MVVLIVTVHLFRGQEIALGFWDSVQYAVLVARRMFVTIQKKIQVCVALKLNSKAKLFTT